MRTIEIELPHRPYFKFTDDALEQLAEKVVGRPVVVDPGKPADRIKGKVGSVVSARVDGGKVRATLEVEDAIADLFESDCAGFGLNATVAKSKKFPFKTAPRGAGLTVEELARVSAIDVLRGPKL